MHGSSQAVPLPLTTLGGLVTLANPETVPEGASPRTYDTDFLVGSAKSRAGLTSQYLAVDDSIGPQAPTLATTTTWTNASAILSNASYATFGPVDATNAISVTEFSFDVPATSSIVGLQLSLNGYANSGCNFTAQLLINGLPAGAIVPGILTTTAATVVLGSVGYDWGLALAPSIVNATNFGVQIVVSSSGFPLATAFLNTVAITLGISTGDANFQFIDTFVAQNGDVKNLSLDANGNFYVEDVTNNPRVQTLVADNITPGSYAIGVNGPDVEYLALSNLETGSDQPLQYTPNWIDRITQVGPAIPPVFTPQQATTNTYAIATITQPAKKSDPSDPGFLQDLLWSVGPTSTAPGNVITVFYAESPDYNADPILTAAYNSGNPVYVYMSGLPSPFVDGTYQVTSVGLAVPPGGEYGRWYFTYQVTSALFYQYGGPDSATGYYQQTLATMTMSEPVPGLVIGNQVTISGASVTAWDAQWTITQALNSSQMVITGSSVTASLATFQYALSGGSTAAPAVGQLVTITGTTNADGQLNLTNATIVTASGGTSGTFKVNVSLVNDAFAPEDGQATTAGTIFCFDPGAAVVGTTTSPIYGNSTGGTLTFVAATAQLIATGTKQGSVFFITRNGYYTKPAPPVTFAIPENTTALAVSQIPVGPPNVVARGIILTESGQQGVPGANFYTIPVPVTYIVENVNYTATALIINDNVSTSAVFTFTDSVLLNALAVDVYGYNLFNQIEIGDPGWVSAYDTRNAYGLCRNKIQNFINLSFDGGFFPGGVPIPLGWSTPDIYGSLIVSAKFGNAYYVRNTSTSTLAVAGLIQQTAYQDYLKDPIIQSNTAYSVRVSAQIPSGNTNGNLVVSLVANGVTFGSFTLPFSEMTTNYAIYEGTILTTEFPTVPPNLQLVVQVTNLGVGADVAIDRIDLYPTAIPILANTVFFSYSGLPEQVDSVTGAVVFASENQQPVNGGMVLYDTFYGLKGWYGNAPGSSLYSLQGSSNLEPAQWQEPEVAQRSGGAIGPLAFDLAEQWFLGASRQGLYLFEGGQPGKIMQEIYQVWDAINWEAGNTIWVKVDIIHRKIFVGVPLATPNFWLPNAAPQTTTNAIIAYQIVQTSFPPSAPSSRLTLTFANPAPEVIAGQMYTLSSMTANARFNGKTFPVGAVSGNSVSFSVPGGTVEALGAETGSAFISPINPISPNVILMCNYQGIDTGAELKTSPQMHTTMFGSLNAIDMRRKWSIWQIASPYANICQGATDEKLFICNGSGNSQIYYLDENAVTDAGNVIDSLYTTAGLPNLSKRAQIPGLGNNVVRFGYMYAALQSGGNVAVRLIPNRLLFPEPEGYTAWKIPGGLTPGNPALYDAEASLNFAASRSYVEFRENNGFGWSLSNLTLLARKDAWNASRGRTGA